MGRRATGEAAGVVVFFAAVVSARKNGTVLFIVKCSKPLGGKADCCGAPEGLVRGPETSVEESTNQFGPWTYARAALTGIVAAWVAAPGGTNVFFSSDLCQMLYEVPPRYFGLFT